MRSFTKLIPAAALLAACVSTQAVAQSTRAADAAQPGASAPARGPGAGPGYGPGAGPRGGMGPGMHGGMMRGGRFGPNYTPGWGLMTPQERNAHRDAMAGAQTYEDCRKVVDAHVALMQQRAQERGGAMPGPRHDPCIGLPAAKK